MIETRKGAKDWLQSKGIDSYGVGSGLLDEFNKDWVVKITTEKIPTSKKNKGR
ncbi:hypothetical protein [Paenibacillus amylolyticus]|uniref:hypothetical protein n=1 Tax=Paenibacillus amylolyticus TaxID=1451 RepID=UPI00339714E1